VGWAQWRSAFQTGDLALVFFVVGAPDTQRCLYLSPIDGVGCVGVLFIASKKIKKKIA
jgi:hypothetical protein